MLKLAVCTVAVIAITTAAAAYGPPRQTLVESRPGNPTVLTQVLEGNSTTLTRVLRGRQTILAKVRRQRQAIGPTLSVRTKRLRLSPIRSHPSSRYRISRY